MSQKIILTGGTSGIGEVVAKTLLSKGWHVIMLARNTQKAHALRENVQGAGTLEFISCDLTDLSGVKKVASQIKQRHQQVDVLMNNAGAIFQTRQTTADKLERTFALNHLGHFLLTTELIDLLISSKSRIINVSSEAHKMGTLDFEDLQWERRKYNALKAYGDSKLSNIYFTHELHRRFKTQGITAFACHPGVVRTNFAGEVDGLYQVLLKVAQPFMISPEKGAQTQLYLATTSGLERLSGKYFSKSKVASTAPKAKDEQAAVRLWEVSEEMIAGYKS